MTGRELSRRDVLRLGGGGLVVVAAGAVGIKLATDDATGGASTGATAASRGAKEAPQLAALVEQGKLPPLAQRLPAAPLVVRPVDALGQYGGTWSTVGVGPEDTSSWMLQTVYYDNVVAWDRAFKGGGSISDVRPNLAEKLDFNRDGTEYVFKLRKGIRWSDGKPFTAADVVFAVNDIAVHPKLAPAPSPRFTGSDGAPCRAQQVDEHTVKLVFPTPNALFLQGMCSAGGFVLAAPKHYLEQFHEDYAKGLGKDWVTDFAVKNNPFSNADRPTVTAWKVTAALGAGTQAVVERNPYYWKTDPEGRQLPYLDKVVFAIVSDPEVALAQVLNGQVGLHARTINTTRNKPVMASNRGRGGYKFLTVKTGLMNKSVIMLNLTSDDRVKRKIFQNRDFRIGLSHAIDRREIIDSVFVQQGRPWQAAPRQTSPFYDEQMATQYTEFDRALAGEHLDRAGYPLRGGARIGPDGKPIKFVVLAATVLPDTARVLEFVKRSWQAVGIEIRVQNVDETLFFERVTAGAHDAAIWEAPGGDNPILYPAWYIPVASRNSNFATQWALWYESRGKSGEEPPANVKAWLEGYQKVQGTTDAAEQQRLMSEVLAAVRDEFPVIGIVMPADGYGIVKNDFHNVPTTVPGDLTFPSLAPTNPEQYWIS